MRASSSHSKVRDASGECDGVGGGGGREWEKEWVPLPGRVNRNKKYVCGFSVFFSRL